jgi:hypothetical protein
MVSAWQQCVTLTDQSTRVNPAHEAAQQIAESISLNG